MIHLSLCKKKKELGHISQEKLIVAANLFITTVILVENKQTKKILIVAHSESLALLSSRQ